MESLRALGFGCVEAEDGAIVVAAGLLQYYCAFSRLSSLFEASLDSVAKKVCGGWGSRQDSGQKARPALAA